MKPKIIVFTTGGTIAMRYDPAKGGAVPAVSGKELVDAVPPLADVCRVELREFSNIPSFHMTPQRMRDLAHAVESSLTEPDVAGAVITHGTDTIEETAYFLDMYTDGKKPVCLTAAMRSADGLGADGPYNILCAARAAASVETRGYGVFVVMNNEIHAARAVTKTHAANIATFASPFWGPLGYVDDDRIVMRRAPLDRQHLRPEAMAENVPILKIYTGMDARLFDYLGESGIDGLVIEGFGRGNVPDTILSGLQRLIDRNIPIIASSRVYGGRILDSYAVEGGAGYLKSMGIILGGEHTSQKARLKLMLALGLTRNPAELQAFFT